MEANPDFDYAFLDAEMVSARLTLSMSIIFKSFPIRVHVLGLNCIITPRQTASFSFATVPCCRCITIPSFKFPPSIIFTFLFDASPVMQSSVHPHPQIHYDHYIPFPPSTLQPSTSSSRSILTTNPPHPLFSQLTHPDPLPNPPPNRDLPLPPLHPHLPPTHANPPLRTRLPPLPQQQHRRVLQDVRARRNHHNTHRRENAVTKRTRGFRGAEREPGVEGRWERHECECE
jgi:hypothetical protein